LPPAYVVYKTTSFGSLLFTYVLIPLLVVALFFVAWLGSMFMYSKWNDTCKDVPLDVESFLEYKDAALKAEFSNARIPIETLYEAYFAGKVNIKGDVLDALYKRQQFANFQLTPQHFRFLLTKLIPEGVNHSKNMDKEQVTEHYDRGNDFYNWFLGPMMIYTSGIFQGDANESLEDAQKRKLELVCRKLQLRAGEKLLDIGCGWGTLVRYAAQKYGAEATGVTLAKEQVKWATDKIKEDGTQNLARCLVMDYRDVPTFPKYDKISCVEMSEHVGIWKYHAFLDQIRDTMEDDGIFYLQVAGLRRAWQFEDLEWGIFMGTYVFPGADASTPLAWYIWQLEGAGFEVSSIDNVGIHYSATLKRWYDNWVSNKAAITKKYGDTWYRKWVWFLAWAVIASEQGSATCWQIAAHKNTCTFDRKRYIQQRGKIWAAIDV
jgi:cyclopropane fatty-acyl-phospholipid synthase-like methyltransferase